MHEISTLYPHNVVKSSTLATSNVGYVEQKPKPGQTDMHTYCTYTLGVKLFTKVKAHEQNSSLSAS